MKVVFLLTQDRGGPVDLTVSLAQELAGRPGGPEVTILGPSPVSSAGLPSSLLRTVHVRSKSDAHGFAAVSRWLDKLAPDVVHAQDRRAGLVSALVVGRRAPVVLTFHGVPNNAASRWVHGGPLRDRRLGVAGGTRLVADALVARRVRCTVAPSRAIAEFLVRELRVPRNRLRVLPNGVDIPAYCRPPKAIRTFTTVGKFAPGKAMPMLVEAFAGVAANHAGLRLRMVGDGADRHRCETLARQVPGGPGNVEFTGYRTDVGAQLEQADAFVLPSLNENMPLALLQAMAMGLVCIATDVGGIPEVLDAGSGILVPPGNASSLRAAMERIVDDPGLAATLGAAARRRAEQFSLSRCADGHLRLWSEILGAGHR